MSSKKRPRLVPPMPPAVMVQGAIAAVADARNTIGTLLDEDLDFWEPNEAVIHDLVAGVISDLEIDPRVASDDSDALARTRAIVLSHVALMLLENAAGTVRKLAP